MGSKRLRHAERNAAKKARRRAAVAPKVGDCFPAALYAAEILAADLPSRDLRLVHGLPIGTGVENGGRRYWHAWVEVGGYAFDFSNGKRLAVPVETFYAAGKLDADHVWKWTYEGAQAEMAVRGHAGPWIDNYEGMGL